MFLSLWLKKSPAIISTVAGTLLTYQAAVLTWSVVPEKEAQYQWHAPPVGASDLSHNIQTGKLQDQNLFGKAKELPKKNNKKAAQEATSLLNAPKTRLALTLTGVVAATDPSQSSAIIIYQGRQGSYFIDSPIKGTNANVHSIYQDRIILDVGGVYQTLMLDGVEDATREAKMHESPNGGTAAQRPSGEVQKINLDRKALLKDPGKLTDFINISPVRVGDKIKGYRVRPGKDRALFDKAGLKNGDLAVEVNGIDLTDIQQTLSLMKELPTLKDISLTVDRGGQLHNLYLSIP